MKVVIVIDTENEWFKDAETQAIAYVLVHTANKIAGHPNFSPGHDQPIIDPYGNECGFVSVYSSEKEISVV